MFDIHPKKATIGNEVIIDFKEPGDHYTWEYDEILLELIHQNRSTLKVIPLLSGTYEIKYIKNNQTYSVTLTIYKEEELQEKHEETTEEKIEELTKDIKIMRIPDQDIPHFVKRNARYRGHRESEKFLNSHQEQIFDIRKNFQNIEKETKIIEKSIENWLNGEILEKSKNHLINGEKVHQARGNVTRYEITSNTDISHFSSVVVKLNNKIIDEYLYKIDGRHLIIDIQKILGLDNATLHISYEGVTQEGASTTTGLNNIQAKIGHLIDKVSELERRYMSYENAYK